jgi:hypothetical protein
MGYYQDLYEKSKKTGVSQTKDGGAVKSPTTTNKTSGSGANTVSSASANLGAGKATGGITGGDTGYKNSTKKSSGGGKSSGSSVNVPKTTTPTLTYSAPTVSFTPVVQPAKTTPTNVKAAIGKVEKDLDIATNAYKQKLAANQRRTTNQGMYNDDESDKRSVSEATFGAMYAPGSKWVDVKKTAEEPKTEAAPTVPTVSAPVAPVAEKTNRELALEEALAELEAELEAAEEYDPMEKYMQAIIDQQNAQAAAQIQVLQNQSGVLNQQYDNNAANLYAQYRRSGLAMPELMAGTATGIADSYTLQNNLNFQNNLVENELERASAQNQLNAQANQIQADADLQAAQTAAEWAQMAYQRRQQELAAQREYQLDLLKEQNKDSGYTINELDKMFDAGIIDASQYAQLAGVAPSTGGGSYMTESAVLAQMKQALGNYMTPQNILDFLQAYVDNNKISQATMDKIAASYGMR